MNLLLLGKGKTGALVAEVARERGHNVRALGSAENPHGSTLTREALRETDVVIDFTNPTAALENIRAWIAACKSGARSAMIVGTTGWYEALSEIRREVETTGSAFLYASNFSIGVNIFFEIARAAGPALAHGYDVRIVERHHAQKKDAPSGTALAIRERMLNPSTQYAVPSTQKGPSSDRAGVRPKPGTEPRTERKVEITSIREGDTVGQHVIVMDGPNDTMMLVHDSKSRRGFAEGAVLAAEWTRGKQGFFTFADVLQDVPPSPSVL